MGMGRKKDALLSHFIRVWYVCMRDFSYSYIISFGCAFPSEIMLNGPLHAMTRSTNVTCHFKNIKSPSIKCRFHSYPDKQNSNFLIFLLLFLFLLFGSCITKIQIFVVTLHLVSKFNIIYFSSILSHFFGNSNQPAFLRWNSLFRDKEFVADLARYCNWKKVKRNLTSKITNIKY